MKSDQTNFVIFGQFTNNRGDQAQAVALAYKIREYLPYAKINYIFFQHDFPVHPECEFMHNVFVSARRSFIGNLLHFISFRPEKSSVLSLIRNADVVLMPPGGPYIGDLYDWETEFYRAACFFWAKYYGKKTMIYAPSMGPFNNPLRKPLHRYILRKADVVCVRDRISKNWAEKLRSGKDIHLTADSAMQRILTPAEIDEQIRITNILLPADRLKIGMTPIDLSWHPYYGSSGNIQKLNENIIETFAQLIRYLIHQKNAVIFFYPQLYGTQHDIPVIEKIVRRIKKAGEVKEQDMTILDPGCSSDYQQAHLSRMDYFIGTRYHSLVFSAMYHVPFVGLIYEHKTDDLVNRLGMAPHCLPMEQVNTENLIQRFENIVRENTTIRRDLTKRMGELQHAALENSVYLYDLYKKNSR